MCDVMVDELREEPRFCYGSLEVTDEDILCEGSGDSWRAILWCQNVKDGCNSHRFHISPRYWKSGGFEGEIYLEGYGESEEEAIADLWERVSSEGLIPKCGIGLEEKWG